MLNQNLHTDALVEMWNRYIDWPARRKGENGFLENTLRQNNCKTIFNAALGDGCDTIHLLKNGFDVTNNEIDLLFMRKALENAALKNVSLNITQYDWCSDLSRHFGEGKFDAVLCVGNSLTYIFRKKDRMKTLEGFYKILRPGGILLIDERNYQYILDNRNEILRGNFRYSGKYVYCGKTVKHIPIKITNRLVRMKYEDMQTGKTAFLDLLPFKEGQMKAEIQKASFCDIKQFSDYKEGFDKNADFFQYVARKPHFEEMQ